MNYTDFKPLEIGRMALDLSMVEMAIDPDAPEIWIELSELVYVVLRNSPDTAPLTDEQLARCAVQTVYQMASTLGGQSVYLPIGIRAVSVQKKREIAAAFKGHNHAELARKHGVTETRIRQILAERKAVTKGKTK